MKEFAWSRRFVNKQLGCEQKDGGSERKIRNGRRMAPQVGFEPHPGIPTAETIVLKIVKNTRKTSVDAGFEGILDLSLKAGKACQVGGRQYKSGTFFWA
jgi:hypothetical protein